MYEVYFNNEKVYQNDIITLCVNNCLQHIGQYSFKTFNQSNELTIHDTVRKIVIWNSKSCEITN